MLYVSFGSKVRPRTFICVDMGSAVLFIVRSRLLVYSVGSGVNRVQVVLSGFSVRLLCFVQVWLYVCLGCDNYMILAEMLVRSSLSLVCVCLWSRKICSYRVLQ